MTYAGVQEQRTLGRELLQELASSVLRFPGFEDVKGKAKV